MKSALDVAEDELELARSVGADRTCLSNPDSVAPVEEPTGGRGADAVFDFVGIQPTPRTSRRRSCGPGEVVVVGVASGAVRIGRTTVPLDVDGRAIDWGSRTELMEVVELAERGAIDILVERYALDQAPEANDRLHAGKVRGRAVIVP